jgi:trans-2,3-dihydro-3-hydroxyanthranilate isomerase
MRYHYLTADVFTDHPFGGNQLAVFPDARGLSSEQMLALAREFNYSETTFCLPPDDPRHTRRVRIFTPGGEVPFAGHPTVGTAFVLATTREIKLDGDETRIVLEEGVGPVPVTILAENDNPHFTRLSAAKMPEVGPPPPSRAVLAAALNLQEHDLLDGTWAPQAVSCGLPFLFVPLHDRDAVRRARPKLDLFEPALADYWTNMVFVFARDAERPGSDVRARMFAPAINVPEDPATGSACAALGGYLADRETDFAEGTRRWVVEQGFEMGRPSIIEVEVDRAGGRTTAVRVGGRSVMMCEGSIEVR